MAAKDTVEENKTEKTIEKKVTTEKTKTNLIEEIKYMNPNQLDVVLTEVAKRTVSLKKDKTGGAVKRLLSVFRKACKLKHSQLVCVDQVAEVVPSAKDEDMNYISAHLKALTKGETVRVGKTEYPWIREPLVNFTYAANYTSDFMYYLIKLSPEKRANLSAVTEKFSEVNNLLLDIVKLTRHSKPKNASFKKLKDTKKTKKSSTSEKSKVEKPAAKTETKKEEVKDSAKEEKIKS